MAVYRVQRTRDYTVMSNYHLRDKNLTLRGLAAICKEGVDAIGSALKELETAGYIVRRQLRGANGRITDTEYIIYERPHPKENSTPDTPAPGNGFTRYGKPGYGSLGYGYAISGNARRIKYERI